MAITKKSFRSGPFKDFIAQAVQVDNVLYISGQVGIDAEGNTPESFTDQVTVAYANIKAVLAEFGGEMTNIIDETVFVTDMAGFMAEVESIFKQRAMAYGGEPEVTQTLLQVVALVQPELKVEIKCVAHL
ncbi:MAG: RidA family protein [Pseudomonadales bacterium]